MAEYIACCSASNWDGVDEPGKRRVQSEVPLFSDFQRISLVSGHREAVSESPSAELGNNDLVVPRVPLSHRLRVRVHISLFLYSSLWSWTRLIGDDVLVSQV